MSGPILTEADFALLARYPRPVFHMRKQLEARKLLPVFGAGASRPIGLPSWDELVSRIATRVTGSDSGAQRTSQTSRMQLIYGKFRQERWLDATRTEGRPPSDRHIATAWRNLVHECLYAQARPVSEHPYLGDFLECLLRAPLTVNYNFDDSLQDLLLVRKRTERFETVFEPTVQYRQSAAVIYHPNGFLPKRWTRGPSPRLVFLEEAFADQLIHAQNGHYATLLSHLCRFTGLLIGLSLEDPTLKHLLRQCAQLTPGHVHYHVAYVGPDAPSADHQLAVRESNFRAYNLVTLFLNDEELGSLGRLLSAEDGEFIGAADAANVPQSYVYYLSGAVGAGKTTTLGAFKNLRPFDEWPEERPENLFRAADQLSEPERRAVDTWINQQMRKRNALIHSERQAVIVVDRSPFDPVPFAADRAPARALELRKLYENSPAKQAVPGMVIMLRGSPDVMHARTLDRHKSATAQYVEGLQQRFESMWSLGKVPATLVDTMDLDEREMIQRVARIIHLEEYRPVDLMKLAAAVQPTAP